ncbi:tripartite tricarboxylate transporter substrate-binding protein [Siccirubricoccus deserti]
MVLVVPAQSRFRSARALLDAVKAEPGRYSWATSGAGGIGHLTGEAIKSASGNLQAEHVPYRGGSAVMEALAKGRWTTRWRCWPPPHRICGMGCRAAWRCPRCGGTRCSRTSRRSTRSG